MKTTLLCLTFCLFLLLTGCVKDPEMAKMESFYKKFDDHCRAHAGSMMAEYDEQVRYDECMSYFSNLAKNCPVEGCPADQAEPYMKTSGN